MYRIISPGDRQAQFDYFRSFANPYASITVEMGITAMHRRVKEAGYPFFLSLLYCTVRAANQIPQLRQRLMGDTLVEYDFCRSSHTVALENGSYCYCRLDCNMPFADFLPYAVAEVERAKVSPSLDDGDEATELYFVTSVPWVSFTSVSLPVPNPADSNPRITFGKYFFRGEQLLLPVSLTVHHALADGIHIGRFFEAMEQELLEFSK